MWYYFQYINADKYLAHILGTRGMRIKSCVTDIKNIIYIGTKTLNITMLLREDILRIINKI